ncbi:hypothetical protein PPUTLS46_011550 [Pseudomonas putida LS46]|nr:hypothetical protein PPUTLS46_011550 [Pseudomonas putida LS46]
MSTRLSQLTLTLSVSTSLSGTNCTDHIRERSGTQISIEVLLDDCFLSYVVLACASDKTREHHAFSESTGHGLALYFDGLRGYVLDL